MRESRKPRARTVGILAALVVAIAVILLLLLGSGGSSGKPLKIVVFAEQYSWHFGYPSEDNAFSLKELHIPDDRPIELELHSEDVVHGFWIPDWEVKTNAIPGGTKTMELSPRETGVYQLICSVSCGLLHSTMHAKIVIEDQAQFQHWVKGLPSVPPRWQTLLRTDREVEAIHKSVEAEGPG